MDNTFAITPVLLVGLALVLVIVLSCYLVKLQHKKEEKMPFAQRQERLGRLAIVWGALLPLCVGASFISQLFFTQSLNSSVGTRASYQAANNLQAVINNLISLWPILVWLLVIAGFLIGMGIIVMRTSAIKKRPQVMKVVHALLIVNIILAIICGLAGVSMIFAVLISVFGMVVNHSSTIAHYIGMTQILESVIVVVASFAMIVLPIAAAVQSHRLMQADITLQNKKRRR